MARDLVPKGYDELLRWSRWRRLHQARAMRSHYRRRRARHGQP